MVCHYVGSAKKNKLKNKNKIMKTKTKEILMLSSYYFMMIVVPASILGYICWKVATFVIDPIPEYKSIEQLIIPKEKMFKEITNENKDGHRYLTDKEKEWVLRTCEEQGLKRKDVKCLIEHESSWDENGWLTNWDNKKGTDRGLFAINTLFHPEVTHRCSFNYKCATKEFIRIVKENGNYNQWHGYTKNCK